MTATSENPTCKVLGSGVMAAGVGALCCSAVLAAAVVSFLRMILSPAAGSGTTSARVPVPTPESGF